MRRLFFTAILTLAIAAGMAQTLPYQNLQLSAAQRADDLLGRLTLEEKVSLMMDTSPAIPRLGIPQFQWWNEALHGVGRNGFATVFPITMAMAASWDDALLHQVFTAVVLDTQYQYIPRSPLGTRPGDLRRGSFPHDEDGPGRSPWLARLYLRRKKCIVYS